jgi:hypothetical protein
VTAPKPLPARPSLDSLRKEAKRLARDIVGGGDAALARARAQLPDAEPPLSLRDAQLLVAREYGYAGWRDLTGEVRRRLGQGLDWAAAEAKRRIHANDVAGLEKLVTDYPALLTRRIGLVGVATSSYRDAFDAESERNHTHRACLELLLDKGAEIDPQTADGLIASRARQLLAFLAGRELLPRTLKFSAALGDLDAVRAAFDDGGRLRRGAASRADGDERAAVAEAFATAARFHQGEAAVFLLDRAIALDPELGRRIDTWGGRAAFIAYVRDKNIQLSDENGERLTPWQAVRMDEALAAIGDWRTPPEGPPELPVLERILVAEPWMLGPDFVRFQVTLVERAVLHDRPAAIERLFALEPAILRLPEPPRTQAIEFALSYGKAHLVPLLLRVWPQNDNLPFAAGMGDFEGVKRWFDDAGAPALGDPSRHLQYLDYGRDDLHWGPPHVQHVLDTALAWAMLNRRFEIADFLLAHGADIDTDWSTHEPASILHELVFRDDYEGMKFLIDRGIDMGKRDYRWNGTAQGWAFVAKRDEKMAAWLEAEEAARRQAAR